MSNAIVYLMAKAGHYSIAYLDDYVGAHADHAEACRSFAYFTTLTDGLGLALAARKSVAPTTNMEWLGYNIDTNSMTVTIPDKKLAEVVNECGKWLRRTKAHKKSLQSLAGRLAFISNCIIPGRKFMARLLAAIRNMGEKNWTTISNDCTLDIKWFYLYAKSSNGVAIYDTIKPLREIECDSSLLGGGGNSSSACYSWKYDQAHTDRFASIHQLEAVNLIVAVKTLIPHIAPLGAKIIVWTDNSASAFALESGRTRDPVLAACAREL